MTPSMKQSLWWTFGFLGGAVAWFAHLFMVYALAEALCVIQPSWFSFLGLSAARWSLIVATVLTAGLAVLAALSAWRSLKATKNVTDAGSLRGARFISWAGLLLDVFFALVILVEALPIFFLGDVC